MHQQSSDGSAEWITWWTNKQTFGSSNHQVSTFCIFVYVFSEPEGKIGIHTVAPVEGKDPNNMGSLSICELVFLHLPCENKAVTQ